MWISDSGQQMERRIANLNIEEFLMFLSYFFFNFKNQMSEAIISLTFY